MKQVIINKDNKNEFDIDEVVTRVKGVIINDNLELLLGYSHKTYQFPGGHLENGESLKDCLKREIKEETGITKIEIDKLPFMMITYITPNYRNTGKTRQNNIYYFSCKTNELFDINNTKYDDYEKEGNYTLKYIKYSEVRNVLQKSINDNPINEIIVEEMSNVLDEYDNYL